MFGSFRVALVGGGRKIWTPWTKNMEVYTGQHILQKCCTSGNAGDNRDYRLRCMYVEYENVDDPDDPVTNPTVAATDLASYYANLSGDRDYLRLFLDDVSTVHAIADGYESLLELTNQTHFYGRALASVGEHGLPFTAAANSKICGVALVAAPDPDDASEDILFGRGYYSAPQQIVKESDAQALLVSYRVVFGQETP